VKISFDIASEIHPIQDKGNAFQTLTMHGSLTIEVVFKSPVQSGLLTLRDMDRDRDRSTITIKGQKTGLDRLRPIFSVFFGLWTGLRLKIEIQLKLMKMGHLTKEINCSRQSYISNEPKNVEIG
jgi:hypothetical protein